MSTPCVGHLTWLYAAAEVMDAQEDVGKEGDARDPAGLEGLLVAPAAILPILGRGAPEGGGFTWGARAGRRRSGRPGRRGDPGAAELASDRRSRGAAGRRFGARAVWPAAGGRGEARDRHRRRSGRGGRARPVRRGAELRAGGGEHARQRAGQAARRGAHASRSRSRPADRPREPHAAARSTRARARPLGTPRRPDGRASSSPRVTDAATSAGRARRVVRRAAP